MNVEAKVKDIVIQTLNIPESQFSEDLAAGEIPQWDSVAHVTLLQAIEAEFSLSFDVQDIIEVEDVVDLIELVQRYQAAA